MRILVSVLVLGFATTTFAAPTYTTWQGDEGDLPVLYGSGDLIDGQIATELPGDTGWHPANPASGNSLDPNGLPAFTDGIGEIGSGLTGLLNDFPAAGTPTKIVQYSLGAATDIDKVRVFSGNNGRDGRVFHTYTVEFSSDGGATFGSPIYVQSHPSGTLNNVNNNQWRVVLTQLTDDSGVLASGVTDMIFSFYAVDNTGGQMRDPYDGVNPFTGFDDGLTAAFVSPEIWEIDVNPVPEPASCALVLFGLVGLVMRRRR